MKSLMILSLPISLFLLFLTVPWTEAGIWKLCQPSTECNFYLTYYCTNLGSWVWGTSSTCYSNTRTCTVGTNCACSGGSYECDTDTDKTCTVACSGGSCPGTCTPADCDRTRQGTDPDSDSYDNECESYDSNPCSINVDRDNCNNAIGTNCAIGSTNYNTYCDATPPECSISSITESSDYAYVSGSTIHYSTASTGSFTVTVSSSDTSGIEKVNFPTTVSNGGGDTISPYSWTYGWDTSDTFKSSATVTCYDNAGNPNTASFTVNRDPTSPIDVSITYTDSYYTTSSVTLTLSAGTDAESGVNTASDYIERQEATLSNGVCGAFGSWSTVKTNPDSSWTDTTVVNGKCYKYRYSVSDNANNWKTYLPSATAKIEITPPSVGQAEIYSGTIYQPGSSYWYKGTISIRDPASDSESGISTCEYTTNDGTNWNSAIYDGTYCKKDNLSPATSITINFRATNGASLTGTGTGRTYTYDITSPITTASATSPPDGASYTFDTWTGNDVKITPSCSDNSGGSGCSTTKYCTDTLNTCTSSTAYTAPLTISSEGITYVRYRSTDNIGNEETTQSKTVKIDKTFPSVNIDSPDASSWKNSDFTLQYDATDTVSTPTCKLYTKSTSDTDWVYREDVTCGTDKTETITVGSTGYCKDQGSNVCQVKIWTQDSAGNTNEATRYFSIDWIKPLSSVYEPSFNFCRSTTSFAVKWSGSDAGGSVLSNYDVQYKKGVGSWTNCLTSTTSTSITFPSGCSSPPTIANGDTFYFQSRARDNAGNVESYPATYDTSTSIDQSGPNSPHNLLPSDGMVTSDNTPDFGWQPPTDNGCSNSISGYEIQIGSSCGSGPTYSTTSTTYTPSTLADGAYYWRAIAKDGFGTWGSWSTCNELTIDTTVSASISINTPPDHIVTNNPAVTFYLSYPSDADKCRYSNDGVWDTELWETCTPTKSWTLTSGYETKIIYFQVKDRATPPNTGQASDSIDYVPDSSFAAGEVNVEGTKDFLHISWDINGFRTRDSMIDCKLNNDPTQTCSIQQKQGKGSCSIVNPAYDFTINENSVECTASYKDNPTISATASKNFKLIDFQVSAPSSLTAIIGEQTEVELTIKNQGILQDSYSLTASVEPPALAGKFNLRESSITTSNVNPNKTTAASFFITPLIETAGSPNLKITAASSVSPAKSQEISIPIKTIKIVIGLPEFHLLGLVQIILLALFLFYFSLKKPIIKNKP